MNIENDMCFIANDDLAIPKSVNPASTPLTVTFILAAGIQARWLEGIDEKNNPVPENFHLKQLLPVMDEMLIKRMFRLAQSPWKYVVTKNTKIAAHFNPNNIYHPVSPCRFITETLYDTVTTWSYYDRVIILLGDVYYTEEAIKTIYEGQTMFYGNKDEIFALHIKRENYSSMINTLIITISDACDGLHKGKLWNLYYNTIGDKLVTPSINFTLINDSTRDFDRLKQYYRWRKRYE